MEKIQMNLTGSLEGILNSHIKKYVRSSESGHKKHAKCTHERLDKNEVEDFKNTSSNN